MNNMKCPYKNFEPCIGKECPACNYTITKEKKLTGYAPLYMSTERAIELGYQSYEAKEIFNFVSCTLVRNNVQPAAPTNITTINKNSAIAIVRKSIF